MFTRRKVVLSFLVLITLGIALTALSARAAGELTPKEARKLIARLAGVELPSDAVRVKSISSFGNAYVVVAQVETAFRVVKGDNDKWRVAEIRTGDRRWEDVDMLVRALNAEKTSRVRAELETIATALESYRREHGSYVEAKTEAALMDHLNPRYLSRIIRLDPWHKAYEYEGNRTSFVLRSAGPDGQPNTADDLTISR
ncbi:MAG TPA: type II secretion system protein GspG [Pyrinomonadaceae bacterium]|nr:type II secretion system protein GspG [Pyrinomonadaceae bacterium]